MKKLILILLFACSAKAQLPAAFYEADHAILGCRNEVLAGAKPSTVTPVIKQLEAALNAMSNAQAAMWGMSGAQYGFPFPLYADPMTYQTEQLNVAWKALANAASLTSDSAALGSIDSAKFYLAMVKPWSFVAQEPDVLYSLFIADYNLSQEEILTVQDIARDDGSSAELMDGLWQVCEFVRTEVEISWGLATGQAGFPMPGARNGIDCTHMPRTCAANILLFPGVSGAPLEQTHGVPYYFRTGMDRFTTASMSSADQVATLKFHPRAWSATDDAGWRLTQ